MLELLDRHGEIAILVILFLEDMGIPVPIPADVALLYAGLRMREGDSSIWFVVPMFLAINIGAMILYGVSRLGGRPMIDRFGHYIHFDAAKLERTEAWLNRRGVWGIMLGRMLPGARIITVIGCGLFRVPLRRYLPAQIVGVTVYMAVLLLAGYWIGPEAVERIKLPALSLRVVVLLVFAIALPLVLRRLNRQTASDDTRSIEASIRPVQRVRADLLAGFVGMIELTALWTICTSLTNLISNNDLQRAVMTLARWLNAEHQPRAVAYLLDYLVVLGLCLGLAVVFFQILMPRFRIGPRSLGRQTLALWACVVVFVATLIVLNLTSYYMLRSAQVSFWLGQAGWQIFAIITFGLLGYAYVAAHTRRLAIDRFANDPDLAPSITAAEVAAHPVSPSPAPDTAP